jgi:hypothetical protein
MGEAAWLKTEICWAGRDFQQNSIHCFVKGVLALEPSCAVEEADALSVLELAAREAGLHPDICPKRCSR